MDDLKKLTREIIETERIYRNRSQAKTVEYARRVMYQNLADELRNWITKLTNIKI